MKKILGILSLSILTLSLFADEVSFRASAPAQVIVGKPFQLTYTVDHRSKDLRAPEMADFDILAGPYTSQSSSTSWVNGKRTSTFTQTYTYTLVASAAGTFTIQPATITVDKQQYTSNGLKIKVLPPDEEPASNAVNNSEGQQSTQTQQSGSNDNIFIRTIVSKHKVSEQECILLQYKLYFAGVDVTQFTNNTKLPEFKGFLKQELEQGEIQTQLEHYNGRNYQTAVLYQTLLYPQHSGDLQIDPASFEAVIRVQTQARVRSIFDDFFGSYTNVTRTLTAPAVKITAEALPKGKPAGFSGGVGQFSLKSSISATEIKQNEAITIKLDITGNGNMKLLKTPAIDFPEGFEEYDPKVTNNYKTTVNGMTGTKSIEYLFIPRAAGEYTIPAIKFSYYDTQEKTYKTLSSPEYTIKVARAAGADETAVVSNFVNKEDIRQLGTDIRYIYIGQMRTVQKPLILFGSLTYWMLLLVPLLIAIVLFIIFRRQIRENADMQRVRYKRANKVAQKRLKQAKQLLAQNQKEKFYEEIERAALLYLSDRLSIPTADLNKDNIKEILKQKSVNEDLINSVYQLLSDAEFARYAPAQSDSEMQNIYNQTANIINQLENQKL